MQFALHLSVLTNAIQYVWRQCDIRNKQEILYPYLPVYLLGAASPLLLVSPLKFLCVNVCMQSFQKNGFDDNIGRILDITSSGNMSDTRLMGIYSIKIIQALIYQNFKYFHVY